MSKTNKIAGAKLLYLHKITIGHNVLGHYKAFKVMFLFLQVAEAKMYATGGAVLAAGALALFAISRMRNNRQTQ